MTTDRRWRAAQAYEHSYWQRRAEQIVKGQTNQLHWYEWKAREMEKRLDTYLVREKRKIIKVIEIGCGPIGIISYLKWGDKHAVDPLENFYAANDVLSSLRDPAVRYIQGTGEKLPFSNESFSLAILDNVLDHVRNVGVVLTEVGRTLGKDGLLYIAVNVHTKWGAFLHKVLSLTNIDKGHPYTFTVSSLKNTMLKHEYNILSEWINDYSKARNDDRSSHSIKNKTKGYIGLSEFVYYAVCCKK